MCKALKVTVASLNHMRHSIGSQWSCLRSSSEDSEDTQEYWYKTTVIPADARTHVSCVHPCSWLTDAATPTASALMPSLTA